MKFIVSLLLLSLPLLALAQPAQLCYGTTGSNFDDWCNINCNAVPSYCPDTFCSCINGPTASASPSPYYGASNCESTVNYIPDQWCNDMCHHNPPYCPPGFCSCAGTPAPTPIVLQEAQPGCCNQDKTLYFASSTNVYTVTVDATTRMPVSDVTLCGEFLSPLDIELASDQSLFVVDTVASRIYRIAPNCGEKTVVLDWVVDGYVPHPRALTITADGGLAISNNDRIYYVRLDQNYTVISVVDTFATLEGVIALDTDQNGNIWFVEPGYVKVYNPSTGVVSTYATLRDFNWPDISGIKVTSCGVYITVTDSNQVWRCTDLNNNASCAIDCFADSANLGADTCTNLQDPYGITVDCYCNVYSAQEGNGNLVFINSSSLQSTVILSGLFHPYDVVLYEPDTCGPAPSHSPTPTPTVSPSPTATPAFQTAIRIDDYNSACASGSCGINLTTALLGASDSRKFGVLYFLNFEISLIGFAFNQCFSAASDGNGGFICTQLIDPSTFSSADFTKIVLYAPTANAPPPTYSIAPAIFGPNAFPNASNNKIVAGQIPCAGFNNIDLRIVLNDPLPCYQSTLFSTSICWQARDSSEPTASTYVNAVGQQQGAFAPFHDVICVVTP